MWPAHAQCSSRSKSEDENKEEGEDENEDEDEDEDEEMRRRSTQDCRFQPVVTDSMCHNVRVWMMV